MASSAHTDLSATLHSYLLRAYISTFDDPALRHDERLVS